MQYSKHLIVILLLVFVRFVFLDIATAFDGVWHDGLVYKLKQRGVSGRFLALVVSFLRDPK